MLRYKILLNGSELTDVAIGVSTIDKFEEPLDEAGLHLPFTVRDYEYEMRGLLSIFVTDDTDEEQFDYLILSDKVSTGSKYGEWKHDLSVMEYTHKLDMHLIHSLVKTKSLLNSNPAPYRYVPNIFNSHISTSGAFTRSYLEPIDIKTQYYSGEDIVIPKVDEAMQISIDGQAWTEPLYGDAYIIVRDLDGNVAVSRHEISDTSLTFDLEVGKYVVEYGFEGVDYRSGANYLDPLGDVPIYQFNIIVIEKEDITIYGLIDLVRQSISKFGGIESKLNYDTTRIFDIDTDIVDYLKSIEAPQTFIQKATARQVLNGIFQYINAISRLRWVEDDNDTLTIDRFNDVTAGLTIEDIADYSSSQSAQDLANKGISWLENILPNNLEEPTIKSPSEGNFKTVRSTNIQITDSTFELKLERPIYQLKKLEVYIGDIEITFGSSAPQLVSYTLEDFILDLTPRTINKEEWNLKLTTVDFPTAFTYGFFDEDIGYRQNKVGNLFWVQNNSSIKLSDTFGDVIQETLVKNVIQEALYDYFTRNQEISPFLSDPYFVDDRIARATAFTYTIPDALDMRFNIEYITLENINAQVEREDLSYSKYYTEARLNQSAKVLNIATSSRKSYGELQRAGVPNISFVKYHNALSEIHPVGYQNDEGYVITQRKFEFHNNFILATYTATKDHNRIAQFIGLDQAYRWAEIPTSSQIYECIESYTDYIVISDPDTDLDGETTKIKGTGAFNAIFGTLMNDWGETDGLTKITLAYVRTDGFLEIYPDDEYEEDYYYAVMTPVASFGIKGGFVFSFGFENNQIAGDSIVTSVSGGSTLYWNNAIRYTNEQGTFNELWFQLSPKFSVDLTTEADWTQEEADANYPLIRTTYTLYGDSDDRWYYCGTRNTAQDALIKYKDRSQSFKVSYQNTIISYTYLEYIFGQAFFANNFIVKNPGTAYNEVVGTPMYLYPYEDGTTYGKFEDLIVKEGYETPILLVSDTNVSYGSREFRFSGTASTALSTATSWAIGDVDGNLYIACNDSHNGFNVSGYHFRPGLTEIGKY